MISLSLIFKKRLKINGAFYEAYKKPNKTLKAIKKKFSKITIIVIRLNKNNELKNSKPCSECIKSLKKYGFKNICYSTGSIQNPFIIEKIRDIQNNHISRFTRAQSRR